MQNTNLLHIDIRYTEYYIIWFKTLSQVKYFLDSIN
jgi:hypothetical protein